MSTKTEVMQIVMLGMSECNFFSSAPVIAHQIDTARAIQPIDLLLSGFTLTGVSLLMSELYSIPVANYTFQPTSIPSPDPSWRSVLPIKSHTCLPCLDTFEAAHFTSHATLQPAKRLMEAAPAIFLGPGVPSLPTLRSCFGLRPSDTWAAIMSQRIPMVIPMAPTTFDRPSGWHDRIATTDFIFLRSSPPNPATSKPPTLAPDVQTFCDTAAAASRKLVLMTFSSMPVPRAKMLRAAVRMLSESAIPLSLLYVGAQQPDTVPRATLTAAHALKARGTLLEVSRADFGVLFPKMDAFIVQGGLGTTVEAMRMRKPVAVTGILLFDQRFWGSVVHTKGIGPPPVHVNLFIRQCVDFVNKALDPTSEWATNADKLDMGDEAEDGVHANVAHFASLLEAGDLRPAAPASRRLHGAAATVGTSTR